MKTFLVRHPQSGWTLRIEARSVAHAALRAALWTIGGGMDPIPTPGFEITECEAAERYGIVENARFAELEAWLVGLMRSCPEVAELNAPQAPQHPAQH